MFQIVNGYFVHYFAPREMPVFPKNVIFVIDRSGSMAGRKIEQVPCLEALASAGTGHTPSLWSQRLRVSQTHHGFALSQIFRETEMLGNTRAQI